MRWICWVTFSLAVCVLLAVASCVVAQDRSQGLSGWFHRMDRNHNGLLEPNEIVTELQVPTQPANAKWTYIKYLPRTEDDYATVSVAAMGTVVGGKIADVRLALGAVGSTAIRASVVEEALAGKEPTAALLREATQAVAGIVDPTDDPRGSAGYKRDMSVVFARRALEQVLGVSA